MLPAEVVLPLRVSHVVFDVDGTLVDFDAALRVALDAVAARAAAFAGAPIARESLLAARETVRVEAAAGGVARTLREIRDESFRGCCGARASRATPLPRT